MKMVPLFSTSGFNLPIENGLVAYWKMDDENATTFDGVTFSVEDNSTLGNDLTITGTGGAVLTAARREVLGNSKSFVILSKYRCSHKQC